MRRLPLLLLLVACATANSTTVYKWVDANGVTHYSDQPHPGAEKLEITGAQTYGSHAAAVATPEGFEELERRAYDDTEFVFLRAQ